MAINKSDIVVSKGTGLKTGGRKAGSLNVTTSECRKRMLDLLDEIEKQIAEHNDIRMLEPRERLDFYVKIMSYLCPKPVERTEDAEFNDVRTAMALVVQSVKNKKRKDDKARS